MFGIILIIVAIFVFYYVFRRSESFTSEGLKLSTQIVDFIKQNPDASFVEYVMYLDQIDSSYRDLATGDTFGGMRDFAKKGLLTPEFLASKFNM